MIIDQKKLKILEDFKGFNNLFITGNAGTGKSFLIEMMKNANPYSDFAVTASTGIAAVKIGGVTIHSWAGLGTGEASIEYIIDYVSSGKGTQARRRIKKTNMLIIDEISMISAEIFDKLNLLFKHIRGNNLAFGGIQIAIVGDFFQLPPVKKNNNFNYCFESSAWREANFKNYLLPQVYRQNDDKFVRILNNIRLGTLSEIDISILKSREFIPEKFAIEPTILTTHNDQTNLINSQKMKELPGKEYIYRMKNVRGTDTSIKFLKDNSLIAEELLLKENAQVMMLKNYFQKDNIVNGSLGIIEGFSKDLLPKVRFMNGLLKLIEPQEWSIEVHDEALKPKLEATISQIPLAPAWAMTIHKSQGMSLDSVYCDLGKIFVEGQAYVALSRAKNLENLYIKNFDPRKIKLNEKVANFYKSLSFS